MANEMPRLDPPASSVPPVAGKKRGRPPGSKNKPASSLPPGESLAASTAPLDSKAPSISDDETGRIFAGAFMVVSLGLGPHWRLFPHEEFELGRCFGPLARRYPDKIGAYADLLMCGPVVASVIVPRVGVQVAIEKGNVPKEHGREALSQVLNIIEHEKRKTASAMAKEGEALQQKIAEAEAAKTVEASA